MSGSDEPASAKADPPTVRRIASSSVNGYGITYVPNDIVGRQLASGELALVLDDWSPFFGGYFLCYPSHRQNLPAFKVVVDDLRY